MTVGELIKELSKYPRDMAVQIPHNGGGVTDIHQIAKMTFWVELIEKDGYRKN